MPVRTILALLVAAGAYGCATIDETHRVAGWPELRVVEHYVSDDEMRSRCSKYVAFGFLPEACSEFYLAQGECHIWLSKDYPPAAFVVRHERLHCEGYDHPGETNLRDILARYQQAQRAALRKASNPGTATSG
jgi:hypothetical protein